MSTLKTVLDAVSRALQKYSSDNIDVVRNEETGFLDVIYHSDKNSFPIESKLVAMENIDKEVLELQLSALCVGHCW